MPEHIAAQVAQLGDGELHAEDEHEQHHAELRHVGDRRLGVLAAEKFDHTRIGDQNAAAKIADEQRLPDAQEQQRDDHHRRKHDGKQREKRRNIGGSKEGGRHRSARS